jgi:hypothetical protein
MTNIIELKRRIINKGPIALWFRDPSLHNNSNHAYLLAGWRTVNGVTEWHLKDSWEGDSTWRYSAVNIPSLFGSIFGFQAYNVYSVNRQTWSGSNWANANPAVNCTDADGDGYYFWGLGPKPASCSQCNAYADGDDSNPGIGPLNIWGNPYTPAGSPPATPGSIYEPVSTVFCQNRSYVFKINAVPCANSYLWSYTTTGPGSMILNPAGINCYMSSGSGPGNFTLTVKAINAFGQSAASTRWVSIYPSYLTTCGGSGYPGREKTESVDIAEDYKSIALDVYPMPAKELTSFNYYIEEPGQVRLSIKDLFGREVSVVADEYATTGLHVKTIDVTGYSSTVHFAILQKNGQKITRKFVINP